MWLRVSCWWFIVFCDLVGCFLGGVSGRLWWFCLACWVLLRLVGFVWVLTRFLFGDECGWCNTPRFSTM